MAQLLPFRSQKGKDGEDLSYPLLTSFAVYNVAEIEGIDFDFGSKQYLRWI